MRLFSAWKRKRERLCPAFVFSVSDFPHEDAARWWTQPLEFGSPLSNCMHVVLRLVEAFEIFLEEAVLFPDFLELYTFWIIASILSLLRAMPSSFKSLWTSALVKHTTLSMLKSAKAFLVVSHYCRRRSSLSLLERWFGSFSRITCHLSRGVCASRNAPAGVA